MQILGLLIIVGVLGWIAIVTLPYLWWLWLLIAGYVLLMREKKK